MYHLRYGLTHHPGISSNITNTTHFSKPPMRPTLAHLPLQPHQRTTHVTYAGQDSRQHVTHADMSSTLARHQRKHNTHTSKPPAQTRYLQDPHSDKEHAISKTSGYPISSQIPGENLAVFTFSYYLYNCLIFQTFLSIFIKVWKTDTEKLNFFQRKLVCIIQKTVLFSKTNAQYFKKETVFKCQCRFDHFVYFKFAKLVY